MAGNLSIIEAGAHQSMAAYGAKRSHENGSDDIGFVHQAALPAPAARREQTWASALAMVQGAADQLHRYDHVLRTMANDVIRITFRSNAEKAELEKRLAALDADHQLALELLKVTHVLCGTMKSRLETFEPIPAEIERNYHRAARYISKLRHSQAQRLQSDGGAPPARHE